MPSLISLLNAINDFEKRMGSGGRHAKYVKDFPKLTRDQITSQNKRDVMIFALGSRVRVNTVHSARMQRK